ncbi:hypothetical protein [Pseudomonas sp.]|nr:hypothetical protein [Pseudomonas sp.]
MTSCINLKSALVPEALFGLAQLGYKIGIQQEQQERPAIRK